MPTANIDLMGRSGGQGDVAAFIQQKGLNVNSMRPFISDKDNKPYISVYKGGDPNDSKSYQKIAVNAATLRKDEWKQLDTAILSIAESRLNGIQDLISKGLTFDLGNALGTTVLESQEMSDAMEAEMSMDGVHRGKGDRQQFSTTYLPLPIIHVDYDINARVLAASRSLGNPLDTTQAERAARRVSEKLESMLFQDEDYSFGGGTIYSYINYPNRNQVTMDTAWDDSSMDGEDIVKDVLKCKQELLDNHFYGPYTLYISSNYETLLDEDYNTTRGNTIRERISAINGVDEVKVVDYLPDDTVIMVQMTADVVRLVRGLGITNVEWSSEGNMTNHYKVMTIQVPQIRADYDGHCGIVHMTTA
ncbi:MAG: major capsid protein [Petrotogales bacterium]